MRKIRSKTRKMSLSKSMSNLLESDQKVVLKEKKKSKGIRNAVSTLEISPEVEEYRSSVEIDETVQISIRPQSHMEENQVTVEPTNTGMHDDDRIALGDHKKSLNLNLLSVNNHSGYRSVYLPNDGCNGLVTSPTLRSTSVQWADQSNRQATVSRSTRPLSISVVPSDYMNTSVTESGSSRQSLVLDGSCSSATRLSSSSSDIPDSVDSCPLSGVPLQSTSVISPATPIKEQSVLTPFSTPDSSSDPVTQNVYIRPQFTDDELATKRFV